MTAVPLVLATQSDNASAVLMLDLANSIAALLDFAHAEIDDNRESAKATIARASSLLKVELDRQATFTFEVVTSGRLAGWQVHRLRIFVDAHLDQAIRIKDLAAVAQRSTAYFCRAFKRTFGETPHAFVVRRRLHRVCHLMLTTDLSFSEIAMDGGFTGEGLHGHRVNHLRSAAETVRRRFSTAHRHRRDERADSTILGAAPFRSKAPNMLRARFTAPFLSLLLAAAATAGTPPGPARNASPSGAASSGWIHFTTSTNMSILVPVTVNGQTAVAMLYGGPSTVDKDFATATGLKGGETVAPIAGLEVQVGGLTLNDMSAEVGPAASPIYARLTGRPMLVQLGEEVFRKYIVDIDFAHHRLAFRDPTHVVRLKGAVEVPLLQKGDAKETQWVIPLSLDKAAPAWFEVELGNVTGPLLVVRDYAEAHGLFDSRPISERQSGPFHERVVTLDHLDFAGMGFPHAPIAIVPDSQNPPEGITGGVGLPLLSRFHLIFDYPHHRLFAIPNTVANQAPIPKDRIGLYLAGLRGDLSGGLVVAFVSPGSPAEAAGLKAQDRVVRIDGKVPGDWPPAALVALNMAAPGVTHAYTLAGGEVRTVTARDFF